MTEMKNEENSKQFNNNKYNSYRSKERGKQREEINK